VIKQGRRIGPGSRLLGRRGTEVMHMINESDENESDVISTRAIGIPHASPKLDTLTW
jgi:hypothetical protein